MPTIEIPALLQKMTHGEKTIETSATSLRDLIEFLKQRTPALVKHIFVSENKISPFVNIYVDSSDIRHLDGLETKLSADSKVVILVAFAGG